MVAHSSVFLHLASSRQAAYWLAHLVVAHVTKPVVVGGQSCGQVAVDSPSSHFVLPHLAGGVQSAAQVVALSPASHLPSPHFGVAAQSFAQLFAVSPSSHLLSPQTGGFAQTVAKSLQQSLYWVHSASHWHCALSTNL